MALFDNQHAPLAYKITFRVDPGDEVAIVMAARRANRSVSGLLRHITRTYIDMLDGRVDCLPMSDKSANLSPSRAGDGSHG
jgi:hypothetical protein